MTDTNQGQVPVTVTNQNTQGGSAQSSSFSSGDDVVQSNTAFDKRTDPFVQEKSKEEKPQDFFSEDQVNIKDEKKDLHSHDPVQLDLFADSVSRSEKEQGVFASPSLSNQADKITSQESGSISQMNDDVLKQKKKNSEHEDVSSQENIISDESQKTQSELSFVRPEKQKIPQIENERDKNISSYDTNVIQGGNVKEIVFNMKSGEVRVVMK